ncbi:hypothetical protein Asp14428_19050 [Actinoplanes sp. NBRC 14428]|nr:hypothetical protein Asp14428_19050 [Actinoplanes sp. NBRC 14428]
MSRVAPVQVGDVIEVSEPDHCYGMDRMTLRIADVHGLVYLDDGPCVLVDAVPLWPDGDEGDTRYAQIPLAGIRHLPEWPSSGNAS